MPLILILADGARADTLSAASSGAEFPALARLRREGGFHEITSVFPSVTGPAYVPLLAGCFPGSAGVPGLRWFDRERSRCTRSPFCRSYLGTEMRHLDGDLSADARTLLELSPSRFTAMSMLARGASRREQIGRAPGALARIALTHWRGRADAWIALDRRVARQAARRVRDRRPAFSFIALLGVDKASHACGQGSAAARSALRVVDDMVARIRHDAERSGTWDTTRIWVVSDHGHADIAAHDDLAGGIARAGWRVLAHPLVYRREPDVAVMVSGNAMAHLYVELSRRARPWWGTLAARWEPLVLALLDRPSIDLVILPHAPERCEVRSRERGSAMIVRKRGLYSYLPHNGDPLGVGELRGVDVCAAHDALLDSDYPDALVQIAHLAGSPRAGDLIVSAARGWDLRDSFEPMPHVSTHGALLREQMLVPLLVSHPLRRRPRRTADVMPSVAQLLGVRPGDGLDGASFV